MCFMKKFSCYVGQSIEDKSFPLELRLWKIKVVSDKSMTLTAKNHFLKVLSNDIDYLDFIFD